jgi:outer membrane murein-binding lipoprotein Lpp
MVGTRQLWRMVFLAVIAAMSTMAFGQDTPDTNPPTGQAGSAITTPNADETELASEVQRLRTDLDRLQRQVSYLTSLIEQMQSERPAIEKPPAKPAAKSTKKKSGTLADATGPSTPSISPDVDEKVTKTLLVFRDGHKVEATNYAIVGQSLWIYTDQDSKKVPLSDLDVTATKDANSDRGVTFQLPPTK